MNKEKTCFCVADKTVKILSAPDWMSPELKEVHKNGICVDACISTTIEYLWKNDIHTLGCCCGHNKDSPSLVLAQDFKDYEKVKRLLVSIDSRKWEILQWNLISIEQALNKQIIEFLYQLGYSEELLKELYEIYKSKSQNRGKGELN